MIPKEVKGVLVFAVLVVLVLAGFYISYTSLKDNLPEGETFTTFVGNAMKQFAERAGKAQKEKITVQKPSSVSKAKGREISEIMDKSLAVRECFKNGCYDSDGGENFNKKGKVWLREGYAFGDVYGAKTKYPTKIIDGKSYQCVPTDDYCKDTVVIEQSCGGVGKPIKTTYQVCPCDCANGVCIPCPPALEPDLVVKSIAKTALSEQCLNSFTFTICNEGTADINNEFLLTVEANKVKKEYLVKQNKFPELKAGSCANIIVPGLFSIGGFGLDLNQNSEVAVVLDTDNDISEKNENNNDLKETVFTGDAYYYYDPNTNSKLKCDTYCYETDAGKDYPNKGTMTFKYSGYVKNKEDYCPDWDLNQVVLQEQFCQLPIILKTNGKFSNPANSENYNCLDQIPPKKCSLGQCVPLSVTCEDAYGNLGPCLQCLDYEGPTSDPTQFQNFDQYSFGQNADPLVKGTIHYTNIDNQKSIVKDECLSTELLTEYICAEYNKFPLIDGPLISCYKLKTKSGEGHACVNGHCVLLKDLEFKDGQMCQLKVDVDACQPIPPELDPDLHNEDSPDGEKQLCIDGKCVSVKNGFEQCIGPTKGTTDAFKSETVTEIKLLGGKEVKTDFCDDYGDSVVEFYCEGNYWSSKKTSCDALLDKNGKGASCVDSKCVFFDESLMSCKEEGDEGLNTEKQGYVDYTTGYGLFDSKGDDCINEDTLIETYCGGKDNKEIIIYEHSCKEEGKVCSLGACKTLKLEAMQCSDTEIVNGKSNPNKNVPGEINGINQLGEEYFADDECGKYNFGTDMPSNIVREVYCENNQLKEKELICDAGTLCQASIGACVPADESFKSCKVDEKNPNLVYTTDIFGTPKKIADPYCPPNSKIIDVPYCQSNVVKYKSEACPAGMECKFSGGEEGEYAACATVDYSKEKCEETETGAIKTDKFGNTQKWDAYCFQNGNLQKIICTSKTIWDSIELPCGEGKSCNPQKDKCDVIDESKKSCTEKEFTEMVEFTDNFGNGHSQWPYCENDFAGSMPYCDGKEMKLKNVPCDSGFECNYMKSQCQKVDYSKVSCTGPAMPNFDKKEKVIAYNKFGEQVTNDGYSEDLCVKSVVPNASANLIAEFWCVGTEMKSETFECPNGKICSEGVCI